MQNRTLIIARSSSLNQPQTKLQRQHYLYRQNAHVNSQPIEKELEKIFITRAARYIVL